MTQGFNLEGLLRTMLPQITGTIGWIVFLAVVLFVALWLIRRIFLEASDIQLYRTWAIRAYFALVALMLVSLVWSGVSLATSNRFPRSDVVHDSGVYQQMDSHK